MKLEDLVRSASTRVEAVRVIGSAINPLLWLTGLVTPLALVLSIWASETWLRVAMSICLPKIRIRGRIFVRADF